MHRVVTIGTALLGTLGLLAVGCGSEESAFTDSSSSGGGGGEHTASGGIISGPSSGASGTSGTSGVGPTCATGTTKAERSPLYLKIILDGSGSMDGYTLTTVAQSCLANTDNGTICKDSAQVESDPRFNRQTGKKWIAAREALKAYFDAKASQNSDQLGLGLLVFRTENDQQRYYSVPVRRVNNNQASALWDLIRPPRWPFGGTPLSPSMDRVIDELNDFTPGGGLAPGGRVAIVMVTDGVPTTSGNQQQSQANQAVTDRVARARTEHGIVTAIIGVGAPNSNPNDFNPRFLSELAFIGGVAPPGCDRNWSGGGGQPCHLQVTPGEKSAQQLQQEIAAAIDEIAGSLASCNLALDRTSEIDPNRVNVVYTEGGGGEPQQIAKDGDNGWSYDNPDDPTAVILHGEACEQLKADPNGKVDIFIGCPTGTSVVN